MRYEIVLKEKGEAIALAEAGQQRTTFEEAMFLVGHGGLRLKSGEVLLFENRSSLFFFGNPDEEYDGVGPGPE